MLSSSRDALLKLSRTTSPQNCSHLIVSHFRALDVALKPFFLQRIMKLDHRERTLRLYTFFLNELDTCLGVKILFHCDLGKIG